MNEQQHLGIGPSHNSHHPHNLFFDSHGKWIAEEEFNEMLNRLVRNIERERIETSQAQFELMPSCTLEKSSSVLTPESVGKLEVEAVELIRDWETRNPNARVIYLVCHAASNEDQLHCHAIFSGDVDTIS